MKKPIDINVKSKHSLVHIGSLDSFDLTKGGIDAASSIMKYFETGNKDCLLNAMKAYDAIIPNENFGGEYTALRWICGLILSPESDTAKFMEEPTIKAWYEYLSNDDFKQLKFYINYKYHFLPLPPGDNEDSRMLRFLEDFILFSNPDRERWEQTKKILGKLRITPGLSIADVGCGSGYFTFKFADMVKDFGKVYGIEINPLHIDYLKKLVNNYDRKNVTIVQSQPDGLGLPDDVKVDLVFSCSLFHVLYAMFSEQQRSSFLGNIYDILEPRGALIVMDNDLIIDGDLPYHGPYIDRDLLISQLFYYGFKHIKTVQVTKQRYALIFEKTSPKTSKPEDDRTNLEKGVITAMTPASLVKFSLGDDDSIACTDNGKKAAKLFLTALNEKTPQSIDAAVSIYEKIIPNERIGDEYTAFVWFCEYLKADEDTRSEMLGDTLAKEYFDYLSADGFALLKKYVSDKYRIGETIFNSKEELMRIGEYIAFNNPARDKWEKTEQMLEFIKVLPGETIADVGCGSGYFSYKFASLTGEKGRVYATETNQNALSFVEELNSRHNLNIVPVVSALNDSKLPAAQFDKIFMCSMYHAVYVASIEFVKDGFIESIKSALKDSGKLFIVDNEPDCGELPCYYGSGIDRRLVITQLSHYGFRLVEQKQFIPQRYILVFQKSGGSNK